MSALCSISRTLVEPKKYPIIRDLSSTIKQTYHKDNMATGQQRKTVSSVKNTFARIQ